MIRRFITRIARARHLATLAGAALCSGLILLSCESGAPTDPIPPAPLPDTVSFASHVLPLFLRRHCLACHGSDGGLSVATVPDLLAGGTHGPALDPSNADGSLLIQKILPFPPFGARMPLSGGFLSASEVELLSRWVNQGAKDN